MSVSKVCVHLFCGCRSQRYVYISFVGVGLKVMCPSLFRVSVSKVCVHLFCGCRSQRYLYISLVGVGIKGMCTSLW